MRILLIHQYFLEKDDPGGSRFNEMTRMWVKKGHEVVVLAGMVNGATGLKNKKYNGKFFVRDEYQKHLIVLRCYTARSYNVNYLGRIWSYVSFILSSCWGGIFKCDHKYDIIIVTSPPLFVGLPAIFLSKIKRVPYIFEVRDLWPESAIDTGVISNKWLIKASEQLEKLLYRGAKLIVVLTPAFKTNLRDVKGISENKIVYIPNAADFSLSESLLQNFDPSSLRTELGITNKFVVTYVGAHGVANHLSQLIDAAELLKETDIVFLLIGDGMEKNSLKHRAKVKKLSNVVFLDPVPKNDVFKYILASDLGASVLKKADTFKTIYSNKTFDYMACKKPVLMVIDGISKDLIEAANCGVYAEPENIKDIAQKIIDYRSRENFSEQGENGYHYVKENFDRKTLSDLYLEKIKDALND